MDVDYVNMQRPFFYMVKIYQSMNLTLLISRGFAAGVSSG